MRRHGFALHMKIIMSVLIILVDAAYVKVQQSKVDSLKKLITKTDSGNASIELYINLGWAYRDAKRMDSCVLSLNVLSQLTKQIITA